MSVNKFGAAAVIFASAFAAQAAQVQFNVQASIPDNSFYVQGTGWEATTQNMAWDEGSLSLRPFTQNLKMKNAAGGIKAYLQEDAVLTSAANNDPIALTVKVGQTALQTGAANSQEILSKADAASEKIRAMQVSQTKAFTSESRPQVAGVYNGTVTMMFETVPESGN